MQSVNEIDLIILGDDVIYGPTPGESTVTPEMRIKWQKIFASAEDILVDLGFDPENSKLERYDAMMTITMEKEMAFEEALLMLKAFEECFKVTEFNYNSEQDEYTEVGPHVTICFYEKEA